MKLDKLATATQEHSSFNNSKAHLSIEKSNAKSVQYLPRMVLVNKTEFFILLLPFFLLQVTAQCEFEKYSAAKGISLSNTTFSVLCEVNSDGGGWITVLKRKDGLTDFQTPTYADYATKGVGNFLGEFFMSLQHLHLLTQLDPMELIVQMRDGADVAWARYEHFAVGNNSTNYTLSISGYDPASTAGDGLSSHNGMAFSTWDQDNDADGGRNCAVESRAAWWFKFCYDANPLGIYGDETTNAGNTWKPWKGALTPLEEITFKIRKPTCTSGFGSTCQECKAPYYLCVDALSGRRACCESPVSSCEATSKSGRYDLNLDDSKQSVWCDADIQGGDWTSILLRDSGMVDFRGPGWNEYKSLGIGNPDIEHFLSLEVLHLLTKGQRMELLVLLEDQGETTWARYGRFEVQDDSTNYALIIDEFDVTSPAGDSLGYHNGLQFSTHDADHDLSPSNSAEDFKGAGWFGVAHEANPLGEYNNDSLMQGVIWSSWKGFSNSIDKMQFLIRPNPCADGPSASCVSCGTGLYICAKSNSKQGCCAQPASSCETVSYSGIYEMSIANSIYKVKCDHTLDGGGWTQILHRSNGISNFTSPGWDQYAHSGVGQLSQDFFLALDLQNLLTFSGTYELLVEMHKDSMTKFARYGSFAVQGESTQYSLYVSDFETGNPAGDSLSSLSGKPFTTHDRDNDDSSLLNCADQHQSGFWFSDCGDTNPLGLLSQNSEQGIIWSSWLGSTTSLDSISFKIRKKRCASGVGQTCAKCKEGYFLCTDTVSGRLSCCTSPVNSCEAVSVSGIFQIQVTEANIIKVWCDNQTDGGGWIQMLNRFNGSVTFWNLPFLDFLVDVVGWFTGEYFLGLEAWHLITTTNNMELLVQMKEGTIEAWAAYSTFIIGSAAEAYILEVSGFDSTSSAGNSLTQSNGGGFSTYDLDNDLNPTENCAEDFRRPFWNGSCGFAGPLSDYGNTNLGKGVYWQTFSGAFASLDRISFKLRPNRCLLGFGSTCVKCDSGYYLHKDASNGRTSCQPYCLTQNCGQCNPNNPRLCSECADGFFLNPTSNTCEACNSLCARCTGPSSHQCSACHTQALYSPLLDACSLTCPETFYLTPSNTCLPCLIDNCSVCSSSECAECDTGYTLFEGQCIQSCPPHYFLDTQLSTCSPCEPGCTECYGPTSDECYSCDTVISYELSYPNSCIKTCSPGNYFNSTLDSCQVCDSLCETCNGPSSTDCLTCNTGRSLTDSTCYTCSDTPGLTEHPLDPSICQQICGDGLHLGFHECDDGNSISGDGCSQDCFIETDFFCSMQADGSTLCKDTLAPAISVLTISQDLVVHMNFTEPVSFEDIDQEDFEFKIYDKNGVQMTNIEILAELEYQNSDFSSSLQIQLAVTSDLQGTEILTVTLLYPQKIEDESQNPLRTGQIQTTLPQYQYYNEVEQKIITDSVAVFSTTNIRGFATNSILFLIIAIFSGIMWNLTNVLQIIDLLPLVNVHIPYNMREMFSLLSFANIDIEIVKVFVQEVLKGSSEVNKKEHRFKGKYPSGNILVNLSSLIFIWIIGLMYLLILWIIKKTTKNFKLKSHLTKKITLYVGSYLLVGLCESYLELSIGCLLNLSIINLIFSFTELISVILTLISFALLLVLPFLLINILSQPQQYLKEEHFLSRFSGLTSQLRLQWKQPTLVLHFHSLFLWRRLIFVLILFAVQQSPLTQIISLLLLSIAVIFWLLYSRPFSSRTIMFIEVFNEFIILLVVISLLALYIESVRLQYSKEIGWSCVCLVCVCIIANCIAILPCRILNTCKSWKQKCKKKIMKVKVKPVNMSQLNLSIDPNETTNSRSWQNHMLNQSSISSLNVTFNIDMSLESDAASNNSTMQTKNFDKDGSFNRSRTVMPNRGVNLNKSLFKRTQTRIPERESTFKDFIGPSKQSYGDSRHSEECFYL